MGVDTKVTFKPGTTVRLVSSAMGTLLGLPTEIRPFSQSDGFSCCVEGVEVKNSPHVVGCADITLTGDMLLVKGSIYHAFYQFEWGDRAGVPRHAPLGSTGWMPSSRALNIALAIRLVDLFGGSIDYVDSDESFKDYEVKKGIIVPAEDGKPWEKQEMALAAIEPLTKAEVEAAKEYANYRD